MADKKVKLVALTGIWTGTERVEEGATFEATDDQAKRLVKKGAAKDAKEAKKGAE